MNPLARALADHALALEAAIVKLQVLISDLRFADGPTTAARSLELARFFREQEASARLTAELLERQAAGGAAS